MEIKNLLESSNNYKSQLKDAEKLAGKKDPEQMRFELV